MAKSRAPERHRQALMTSLASAFLEWILMLLLFGHATFSYLITKFARYCNLPLPCILCSRLDNVTDTGKQNEDYFQDLFCRNHKSKISSLVLCHAHCKLVDVHKMCETCLFSFATINKSNSETYRLLVGKLGDDPEGEFEEGKRSFIEGEKRVKKMRRCCCCNELWSPKSYPHELLGTFSVDHEASYLDTQFPQHTHRSRKEVEVRDDSQMYHVGYTELKVNSDTESEAMISEYESHAAHYDYEINDHKFDEPLPRAITLVDDFVSEKLIRPSSDPEPSVLVAHPQTDNLITASSMDSESNVSMHGLEELNWHHVEPKAHSSSQAVLISFDDLASEDVCETVVEDVKDSDDKQTYVANDDYCAESSEVKQISIASDDDCAESFEVKQKSLGNGDEGPKETNEAVSDSQTELKNEADLQSSKSLDFGDAYNIAISNKGRQISSGSFGERTVNNSAKISEDLKQLLSQISRGTDLPAFDMSPRVSRNVEELKHLDSNSSGIQMLQKRVSLERNESGLESLDGNVSEVEGESLVDRLKRQIEHDKKLLLTLYKELEEERSASAIAANQAMAMITRLQEEKAALHMDASQYLRMMEEQAEYDTEALQNCNDLLSDRELEIQALEAELEHYRSKYPDEAALLAKSQSSYYSMERERDSKVDQSEGRSFEDRSISRKFSNSKNVESLRTSFRNSFLELENERTFVSDLSNKLKERSENDVNSADDNNDDRYVHREDAELLVEEIIRDEELKDDLEIEKSCVSNRKEGSTSNESDAVSSEKQLNGLDVNHDAISAGKSSPNSPENQHKEWHIVQEVDLEEHNEKKH